MAYLFFIFICINYLTLFLSYDFSFHNILSVTYQPISSSFTNDKEMTILFIDSTYFTLKRLWMWLLVSCQCESTKQSTICIFVTKFVFNRPFLYTYTLLSVCIVTKLRVTPKGCTRVVSTLFFFIKLFINTILHDLSDGTIDSIIGSRVARALWLFFKYLIL